MRILTVFLLLAWSSLSFSAACPTSGTATATGANNGDNCTVTGTQSTIQLNFISGFDSATAASASGGNNGTTVGAQRKLSFIKAAEILADQVNSSVTIIVDSEFSALSCNASSATLGSAGASVNLYNGTPPAGITANTWYPVGLYNALSGTDNLSAATDTANGYTGHGTGSDVVAEFNDNIGEVNCLSSSNGWYYGFDTPPSGYIGFTTVLLHEMTHGFGFASLVSPSTGAKTSGLDDVFSSQLYASANASTWPSLTDGQRATSATSSTGLLWNGSNVNTQAIGILTAGFQDNDTSGTFTSGDRVQMYAPSPVESGSSVSHFNTTASPNELMEPQYTEGQMDIGLALYLLEDIGWTVSAVSNASPTLTAVDQTTNEDTPVVVDVSGWGNDSDGDPLTYSVASCAANVTCSISGTSLTLTPASNHNGATHTITLQVSDGTVTTQDTFNLTITAVNDVPAWSNISDQNIIVGNTLAIDLSNSSSDVEGDSLTYSVVTCPSDLSCGISAQTLSLTANSGAGSSVSVTVRADDGNSGTADETFNVLIGSANPSTKIEVNNTEYGNLDRFTLPLDTNIISVTNGSGQYTYSLAFGGQDVSSLLSEGSSGLQISLPESGAFAGEYTLVITDQNDGDVITLTMVRPLRLTWSSSAVLNGDTSQTLRIEGATAGTQFSINQSPNSLLTFNNASGQALTSIVADNDAQTFNAAVVYLGSTTVTETESLDITVSSSSYDDVSKTGFLIYPSTTHTITVLDSASSAIASAKASLEASTLISSLNLAIEHPANASGQIQISLPNTSDSIELEISATGYQTADLTLDNVTLEHEVTLFEALNVITLSGSISALGNQDFLSAAPTLTLVLSNGDEESMTVTVTTTSQANFSHDVDLDQNDAQTMRIRQQNSLEVDVDISNVTSDRTFNILLEKNIVVVTATDDANIGGSGSGGGTLNVLFLLFLGFLTVLGRPRFNRWQ